MLDVAGVALASGVAVVGAVGVGRVTVVATVIVVVVALLLQAANSTAVAAMARTTLLRGSLVERITAN